MNIVNKILQEWSLRSPDGLASGHTSEQNVVVLEEILSKLGISAKEVNEILGSILSNRSNFLTEDPIDDAVASANKLSAEAGYTGLPTAKSLEDDAIQMLVKKGIKTGNYPEKILNILRTSKVLIAQDVAKKFDTMTVGEAIKYLNTDFAGKEFSDKVNELVDKKGLGRGEYALLFLIKNAVSGGTGTGDLIVNDRIYDVKEFSSGAIRIPAPSVGLKYTSFYRDFFGLANYLIRNPQSVEYLKRVVLNKLKMKSSKKTIEWLEEPDITALPTSVVDALYEIGKFLNKGADEEDVEIVDLKFKGQPPEPMVMSDPTDVKHQIKSSSPPKPVKITVEPLVDKLNQVIIPELKNLNYFVKNRTRDDITEELLKNTYNGGMIMIDEKTGKYFWWKHSELPKKLIYLRMSMSASYFIQRK